MRVDIGVIHDKDGSPCLMRTREALEEEEGSMSRDSIAVVKDLVVEPVYYSVDGVATTGGSKDERPLPWIKGC